MKHLISLVLLLPISLWAQLKFTPMGKGLLPPGFVVNCIQSLNDNEVWIMGSLSSLDGKVKVCKTLDGGTTWHSYDIDSSIRGLGIDLFLQANGIAYANIEVYNASNEWYKTQDGGLTWYKLQPYLGTLLHMYNVNEGAMISVQSGLWSQDSFHSYNQVRSQDPGGPPLGIGQTLLSGPNGRCVNDSGVFFIYPKGYIVRTQDKGKTWKGFDAGLHVNQSTSGVAAAGNSLLAIQWPAASVVKKGLSRSNDGGNSWQNISSNIPSAISRPSVICGVPQQNAHFLMTGYSELYHSTDTGNTWQAISMPNDLSGRMSGVVWMSSSNTAWMGLYNNSDTETVVYRCELNFDPSHIPTSSKTKIMASPNPASESIQFPIDQGSTYALFSSNGCLLESQKSTQNWQTLDLAQWARGIYFIQWQYLNQVYTQKISLE